MFRQRLTPNTIRGCRWAGRNIRSADGGNRGDPAIGGVEECSGAFGGRCHVSADFDCPLAE